MPRSRKKAAAARAKAKGGITKDFVKKKERLGKKQRPENATNTSVRARQIYLPDVPDEEQVREASEKRGLTLAQLLTRSNHYAAGTRVSALNGLARALAVDGLAATNAARADRTRVTRLALGALQDAEASVRNAGVALLGAALALRGTKPLAPLLRASLIAALTHVRPEVQASAARAVGAVFGHVRPDAVFGERVFELVNALSDLLVGAKSPRRRIDVLEALVIILQPREELTKPSRKSTNRPFYYHRLGDSEDEDVEKVDASPMMQETIQMLVKRVIDIVVESMPIHEAKKDKSTTAVLLRAAQCLYSVLTAHNADVQSTNIDALTSKTFGRLLDNWSKERNRHHDRGDIQSIHNYLAACALVTSKWDIAVGYISNALASDVIPVPRGADQILTDRQIRISVEIVAEKLMTACDDVSVRQQILAAWATRWHSAVDDGNVYYLAASTSIVRTVLADFMRDRSARQHIGWDVLIRLPRAVALVCRECRKASIDAQVANRLRRFAKIVLKNLVDACRVVPDKSLALLETEICTHFIRDDVLLGLSCSELDDLVALLYYSKTFARTQALDALIKMLSTGLEVSIGFCGRFLSLIVAHYDEFTQVASDSVKLELYAAASLVAELTARFKEGSMKERAEECIALASKLSTRITDS